MFKCEICNREFDTQQKLGAHKFHCLKKVTETIPKTEEPKRNRDNREPFGVMKQRFSDIPQNDGYRYRVFNDNWQKDPGRIEKALRAGYERVDHPNSGKTVGTNENGSEIKGVLMRIPKEWYEEDQARKEEKLAEIDEQIYRGKFQQQKGDGRYLPKEGISIDSKLTP